MRIVFMGSTDLSCRCVTALLGEPRHTVACIVTQPDRPRGRNLAVTPCLAKAEALAVGVPVLCPEKVNAPESVDAVRRHAPDAIVVASYGQILRRDLLDMPPLGCINVHFSLLPKYRGAAPIQWAIARGDTVTGVTTMRMNERMDAGDILDQTTVAIDPDDTSATLAEKLAPAGAALLSSTLDNLAAGRAVGAPQNETGVTLAPKIHRADGRIGWSQPADDIRNRVRAFNPVPGAFCFLPGAPPLMLKVWAARHEQGSGQPGTVLDTGAAGPLVATGDGALRLLDVQLEGRKRVDGGAFLRGHPLQNGTILE